jgi:hypothetical protein
MIVGVASVADPTVPALPGRASRGWIDDDIERVVGQIEQERDPASVGSKAMSQAAGHRRA